MSDTGQGISGDFLPFMFDRFRQADGTSTRRHGGLGLGLAIARHLIELHGGAIHAQSPGQGCGSTFTIKLPLVVAVDSSKSRRQKTGTLNPVDDVHARVNPARSLDGVKVLLVDDDRDSLQILTLMMIGQRAQVHAASSVDEALQVLQWYRPDVLVSDLAMPGEDGYSLIRKIRALEAPTGKHIPAVALTAYVRVDDRTRALTAGFNIVRAQAGRAKRVDYLHRKPCEAAGRSNESRPAFAAGGAGNSQQCRRKARTLISGSLLATSLPRAVAPPGSLAHPRRCAGHVRDRLAPPPCRCHCIWDTVSLV